MNHHTVVMQHELFRTIRRTLEKHFSLETAYGNPSHLGPRSTGQCGVVSVIVAEMTGARIAQTYVGGDSHLFNRVTIEGHTFDVDLTADQFGYQSVLFKQAGSLWQPVTSISHSDIPYEMIRRAALLAERAGFDCVQQSLEERLQLSAA